VALRRLGGKGVLRALNRNVERLYRKDNAWGERKLKWDKGGPAGSVAIDSPPCAAPKPSNQAG